MTKSKKTGAAKEPVRLRMKTLSNGCQSLYLDAYRDGQRTYEYLRMYLVPETDDNARRQNRATLDAANKIKADRIIALANGEADIKPARDGRQMLLMDWMEHYRNRQARLGKKDGRQIETTIRILRMYGGAGVTMGRVDKRFCQGYIDFLLTEYKPYGRNIMPSTAHNYYRVLNSALNAAVRADLIRLNPFTRISNTEKIHAPESHREYMTIDEVRRLIATPIKHHEEVKAAYLFSCFCGLRMSDIIGLKWENVFRDGQQVRLEIVMQKTKAPIYLPLSPEALRWMPRRAGKRPHDPVFRLPPPNIINLLIKPWARAAGISKHFTFHTARHTFATMMLTLGADLYTTSKLLGHADVRMTQVYARIVNRKKDEAVNLVNGLFG